MKPWQTKEWKEKREQFIEGKVCEQCGSTEALVIHHTNSIMPYNQHFIIVSNTLLAEKIQEGEYKTETVQILTCPKCNTHRSSDLRKRKAKKPKYRCSNCGYEFEEPVLGYKETGRLSRSDFNHFLAMYKDAIKEIVLAQRDEFHEYYKTFDDCVVLCNRCHLALHKGMKLCSICKEKYHKAHYSMCWDCFGKTPQGKNVLAKKEQEEYEDQILEITNPLCGKKHYAPRWKMEFEGTFHLCHEDCDPYSCEIFEKWYNEGMDDEDSEFDVDDAVLVGDYPPCPKMNECEHYYYDECNITTKCPFKD